MIGVPLFGVKTPFSMLEKDPKDQPLPRQDPRLTSCLKSDGTQEQRKLSWKAEEKKKRKERKRKIFCGTQAFLVIAALDQVLDEMESHGNQDLTTDPGQDSTNPEPPQPSNNQLPKPKAHFSRFQILTRSQSNQQSKQNKKATTCPPPPPARKHPRELQPLLSLRIIQILPLCLE